MTFQTIDATQGKLPFDLVIRNVQLLNVFTEELYTTDIGIINEEIAYVGKLDTTHTFLKEIDGAGQFAIPGFIDSHMHIESTMLTPTAFASAVLPLGTTTVAADPHEIANVLGMDGVKMLCDMSRDLPLHVHMMAPSTVPSAPGYETSGADITSSEIEELLNYPNILGLGEVMDFYGVIDSSPRMITIINAAKKKGVLLDGHVPILKGKDLQAFAASGIDCDHTFMDIEIVKEKLRYGMSVQIQERFFTPELMQFLNTYPIQNRIMLVTDDVPISRLDKNGHLNSLVKKAIRYGLDPKKAIRYVTINAADRLRLYHTGAIAPGKRADILLLNSLEEIDITLVISDGKIVAKDGQLVTPLPPQRFPEAAYQTMHLETLSIEDFQIKCEGHRAKVNVIVQDGHTSKTTLEVHTCEVKDGLLQPGSLMKMAIFNRHATNNNSQLGLIGNMEDFEGAIATTYAHDCHNLTVYGSNDLDMMTAANKVIAMGGGIAISHKGEILCAISLPIAGLLSEDTSTELALKFRHFSEIVEKLHLNHSEALTFITLMPLAVSPNVKLTDMGLINVTTKTFLPLIVSTEY